MRWSDLNFEKTNKDLPEAEQPPYAMHRAWGTAHPEEESYIPLEGYNQSKVANLLFSIASNNRLYANHGILSFTLHPGVIQTELSRNAEPEVMEAIKGMMDKGVFTLKSLEAGAATSVVAALDPGLGPGVMKEGKENVGVFLADCQVSDAATSLASSSEEAERLWGVSEGLVGEEFVW